MSKRANELFTKALERVQSESIRKWATSAHNGPLWLRISEDAIKKGDRLNDPDWFAAYIVSVAIGA